MKRILAIVLCAALSLTALAGCAGDAATTEVTVWFLGASVTDDTDVVEAANARLKELGLNVTINPIWGDWGAGEPIQLALDTGDTNIDVVFTCSWAVNYSVNAETGNFVRLDDPENNLLEKYGQELKAAVPDMLWDAFTVQGPLGRGIYGIPGVKDYAQQYSWDVNNTRLAELGFDFNDFEWSSDTIFDPKFEAAMAAAKEKYGDNFFPFAIEGDASARRFSNADGIPGAFGSFFGFFDPKNPAMPQNPVVGLGLENEYYLRVLEYFHKFYEAGYIDPRIAITAEAGNVRNEQINSGNYLFADMTYAYGYTAQAQAQRGLDVRFPPLGKAIVSTGSAQGSGFAIPVFSQKQEAAMKFVNAWYTDTELATILCYGVEGTHFARNVDGTITLDHEVRGAKFQPWRNGQGNIFILPAQDVEGVGYYDRYAAYNAAGVPTTFMGFVFDASSVATETAALANVHAELNHVLTVGAVDPAVAVPEFLSRLTENGIEVLRAELNKQLQEFYASRR